MSMPHAGILLRVALVLSLVLNGISGPIAGSAMAMASMTPASEVDHTATASAQHSGCHDHASVPDHHPATSTKSNGDGKPAHSDCCGVGLCGCACAQLPALAALDLLFLPPNTEFVRLSDVVDSQRPEPPLPHLIRPPIA